VRPQLGGARASLMSPHPLPHRPGARGSCPEALAQPAIRPGRRVPLLEHMVYPFGAVCYPKVKSLRLETVAKSGGSFGTVWSTGALVSGGFGLALRSLMAVDGPEVDPAKEPSQAMHRMQS
jgi:hypothetical protein